MAGLGAEESDDESEDEDDGKIDPLLQTALQWEADDPEGDGRDDREGKDQGATADTPGVPQRRRCQH